MTTATRHARGWGADPDHGVRKTRTKDLEGPCPLHDSTREAFSRV